MREIIFDTETTGLDCREDRIIEIGGVELVNRFPTGRSFHAYINPQGRRVHPDAVEVHGITDPEVRPAAPAGHVRRALRRRGWPRIRTDAARRLGKVRSREREGNDS